MKESKQLSKQLKTAHLTPAQVTGKYQQAVGFAGAQVQALDKRIKYLSSLHTLNEYQKRDFLQLSDLKAAIEGLIISANELTQWRYERHLELSEMHSKSTEFEMVVADKFKALREQLSNTESQLDYALEMKVA